MDRIIIIDDSIIHKELEDFIDAHKNHIRIESDVEELAMGTNPIMKEILDKYESKYRIQIHSKDQLRFFRKNEIIRFERAGAQIRIHLSDKSMIEINEDFETLEGQIPMSPYFRLHEDHFVNINYVKKIPSHENEPLIMADGTELPVDGPQLQLLNNELKKYIS